MVAIARLVRGVLDDRVDGRLLDDTRRIPAGATEFGLQTAARAGDGRGGDDERQQDDRDRRGGTTSHRVYRDRADRTYCCYYMIVSGTGVPEEFSGGILIIIHGDQGRSTVVIN